MSLARRLAAKVKNVFWAETNNRLQNLERFQRESAERRVREEIEHIQKENLERIYQERHPSSALHQPLTQQRLTAIEGRLRGLESNTAAQWDALEQLILAVLRTPDIHSSIDQERELSSKTSMQESSGANCIHAASDIR